MGSRTFRFTPEAFAVQTIFVSTESPQIVSESIQLADNGADAWQAIFTLENRTNVGVAAMRGQKGNGRATLESLLNLVGFPLIV